MATQTLRVWEIMFLLFFLTLRPSQAEVLMEVEFDLGALSEVTVGSQPYTAAQAVNAFLQSNEVKWLRYFVPFLSGKPGHVRARTAHLMFRSNAAVGHFSQMHQNHIHALFDHLWKDTRRVLWETTASGVGGDGDGHDLGSETAHQVGGLPGTFPFRERPEGVSGGYLYQFMYTVEPGKAIQFRLAWTSHVQLFLLRLRSNEGFLERRHYSVVDKYQSDFQEMEQFEFVSMPYLTKAIQDKAFDELIRALIPHTTTYAVNFLHPGDDDALYWNGRGMDRFEEL